MPPAVRNLFIPPHAVEPGREHLESLVEHPHFRLEVIHSNTATSPPDFWYDQDRPEWVTLLRGEASLRFDQGEPVALAPGDSLIIEAHQRHRVESTSSDAVWLAVFFDPA